jgi:hypothetical protein
MRHFQNAVLDYKHELGRDYSSAPMETAWATEAMFFVRLEKVRGPRFQFSARAQISVNGIDWIEEGTAFPPLTAEGQYVIRLKHFGGWLRLVGKQESARSHAVLTTNLVLKE